MSPQFITQQYVAKELAEGTATSLHGDHLLWLELTQFVQILGGVKAPRQASWFVSTGEWSPDLITTCADQDCVLPAHMSAGKTKDEHLLDLVQKASTSTLADLYRKGKARGLLASTSDYH